MAEIQNFDTSYEGSLSTQGNMISPYLSRFQPLQRVLTHDVFDRGHNGWMSLMPNFTQAPDFDTRESVVLKHQWPPVMLSSARMWLTRNRPTGEPEPSTTGKRR